MRLTLLMVYLLILIGGIVRATGSGMGCPDWPRCFGLLVPPTEESQLRFHPMQVYQKGSMVIENDTLWVSRHNNPGSPVFIRQNWLKYPKHDYAVFNVFQTWTEYLNRLFGALTGLFVFVCVLLSIPLIRTNFPFFLLSIFLLVLTGFQGWLGALVVDFHLAPLRITAHMLTAMAMVALLVLMQERLNPTQNRSSENMFPWLLLFLFLLLIQVVMGTQVRQEVDVWMKGVLTAPSAWADTLSIIFVFHRILAALLFFNGLFIFYRTTSMPSAHYARNLLILLIAEGVAGMILSGLSLPNMLQPVHLVISALMFGTTFRLVLSCK